MCALHKSAGSKLACAALAKLIPSFRSVGGSLFLSFGFVFGGNTRQNYAAKALLLLLLLLPAVVAFVLVLSLAHPKKNV